MCNTYTHSAGCVNGTMIVAKKGEVYRIGRWSRSNPLSQPVAPIAFVLLLFKVLFLSLSIYGRRSSFNSINSSSEWWVSCYNFSVAAILAWARSTVTMGGRTSSTYHMYVRPEHEMRSLLRVLNTRYQVLFNTSST